VIDESPDEAARFAVLRDRMVQDQIAQRGVRDADVLRAMRTVPRHQFIPAEYRGDAYTDRALPIAGGQTISQPYMVAVMASLLRLKPGSHVLEVGTGSGYHGAVLASIAADVVSIERQPELARDARALYARLGIDNIEVVVGDGTQGYLPRAPYDAISVTAGAPRVPEALKEQLADGGRLVVPVGTQLHQQLAVLTRRGEAFDQTLADGCVFVPLIGVHGWAIPPTPQE
jgi:protein-L-isoaspartate(D-aspartate) O-methyltransferase